MSTPVCEKLPWDTAFFGINIARVYGDTLNTAQAAAIDTWCQSEHIACVYFLARSDDPATVRTAEAHGYSLVDVRVELENAALPNTPMPANVRPATAADLPALEPIARTSFTDSRFYADPHFPRHKCDALYVRWVQESVREFADITLIAEQEKQVAGFITCKIENGTGNIGLAGVDARFRGKGLGNVLMQGAISWILGKGVSRLTVVTQARNIASQRLYQRHGFLTKKVGLYFHKWF
jgi:ribosomal protein S18 acetylase RimI-like enzyme